MEAWLDKVMVEHTCPDCNGARAARDAAAVHRSPARRSTTSASCNFDELHAFLGTVKPAGRGADAGRQVLKEIRGRLELLLGIGLDYLNFNRRSGTLSGGESQRIRLSTQIGSGLMGMLYVLDEPSIGLHPKDNVKMIATLESLRDIGNTVIVVEHDEDTIRAADHIVEMGPGPGVHGGTVVVQGTIDDVLEVQGVADRAVPLGQAVDRDAEAAAQGQRQGARRPRRAREQPQVDRRRRSRSACWSRSPARRARARARWSTRSSTRRCGSGSWTRARCRASTTASTASSTSTRSSASTSRRSAATAARIRRPTSASTTPSATSSRSAPLSVERDYKPGRFSFNVKGGRCEECQGEGVITTQLYFMPDVEVTCGACKGARFNSETLEVTRARQDDRRRAEHVGRGGRRRSSRASRRSAGRSRCSNDLGLGYLTLGQSATTLSGGEAQRIKIATELSTLQRVEAHRLHPRRADDRPAPGRRRAAARVAEPAGRRRAHRAS